MLRDMSFAMESEMVENAPSMVTFTHVKVSKDLRHATFYYSVLSDDEGREKVADYLERYKGRLRSLVGQNLHIKHIPEFEFKYDPSIVDGIRMEKLFDKIRGDDENRSDNQ